METRKNTWERKKIVTLAPLYTWAPGTTHTISLVIIHKGVEVIIVQVGSPISAVNIRLGKWIYWAIINHMPQGVTSSTDLKIADICHWNAPIYDRDHIGCQTMMCRMTQHSLSTGRTDVHQAEEPVMTEI